MSALVPPGTSVSDIAVEARGLCKTFRQRQRSEKLSQVFSNLFRPQVRLVEALRQVDLQVRRGEIVAYAGPNGAGKSTTVKILSGILAPDAGQVRVLGLDPIADRVKYVGRIGVVFGQRTELWWDHPVAASYEWKRVVWEIPRPRYERMLGQVRELLGLGEFFHSLTRELSLGQRMRADLGLALLHEPEILFLDEPTSGVDPLARREFWKRINALARAGVTILVTTHFMEEAEYCDRLAIMAAGRILATGEPAAIKALARTAANPEPSLEDAFIALVERPAEAA